MGGIDLPLEEILAEGKRFVQCETPEILRKRNRARVSMLEIHDLIPNIDSRPVPVTFDALFCESLERYQMVVMGIYRLLDLLLQHDPTSQDNKSVVGPKRIVIYYPPYDYEMHPSDMVCALDLE
ncbi:unnamed protein product [Rotaria sp. Silwood2]|nr:unnamed protein product [Rotaria sp. Silwood2]CAF2719356.1 unnamed protein product [Rotaria sp. Silwood2]CAF4169495.1 unnamed protein product [Rotaria sp. Silwood2]CAF4270408.1 unnamed protein product [Rotaria sp. Silwood2]